jgi:RHS repeat-associated protein
VSVRRRASGRAHYNYFRNFDPAVGRYVESDPIGLDGGLNTYGYVFSSPLAFGDPLGLDVYRGPGNYYSDIPPMSGCQRAIFSGDYLSGWGACQRPPLPKAPPPPRENVTAYLDCVDEQEAGYGIGDFLWDAASFTPWGRVLRFSRSAKAYHYTFSGAVASISREGLRPNSFLTLNGRLSPLQAQLDLALSPSGTRNALLRIDLDGMRRAGYQIPDVTRVGRSSAMPGGDYQLQFPYSIPPEFITVVRP